MTNSVADLITNLQEKTNKKNDKGLGYVWGQSTHAVGESFGAIGELATSGRQLALKAKEAAVMSRIESSQEICALVGIEAKGVEGLMASEALVDYICSRR